MADQLWELTNTVTSESFLQDWNETVDRIYNRHVAKAQLEYRTTYTRLHRKHQHRLRRLSEQLPQREAERVVAESFMKKVATARQKCDEAIRALSEIRDSRLLTGPPQPSRITAVDTATGAERRPPRGVLSAGGNKVSDCDIRN